MSVVYVHSEGTQPVEVLEFNGEDMTLVRFENGVKSWVCDSDLRYANEYSASPVVEPTFCEIACPGHHYMMGGGENLISGIHWCPGVERADDDDPDEWYDSADADEYVYPDGLSDAEEEAENATWD
jgi:hypothetical protein